MSTSPALHLLGGLGIELEYMLVDAGSLSVRAMADELIRAECGAYESSLERGAIAWSHELALHVIELKTNGPVGALTAPSPRLVPNPESGDNSETQECCCDTASLPQKLQAEVNHINNLLGRFGARLMPTAMHPWMDPHQETRLWPHDYNPVYEAFNRVFDCRGHGWSNLQSCHLNLPFGNDAEFAQLHAAVRLVLPLLPALAASSPLQDGSPTGFVDNRLRAYRANCARIPSITGRVVPEPVFSPREYQTQILQRLYRDIAPFDPEGTLQDEWLNARGAIARFERNTVEIRLLDVQECPQADLAIAAAVEGLVRALVEERWSSLESQQAISTDALEPILLGTIRGGEQAVISDNAVLRAFGLVDELRLTAGELWQHLIAATLPDHHPSASLWRGPLRLILDQGPLARRILRAVDTAPSHEKVQEVYAELCACLAQGRQFMT